METREIHRTEAKVYKLIMNSIFGRCEDANIVAISFDYDALIRWYRSQKCEPYYTKGTNSWGDEKNFYKVFTQGSPLENYNPINSLVPDETNYYNQGISTEWIDTEIIPSLCGRFLVIE